MAEYTFLFKERNTDDRDCVRYIRLQDLFNHHVCCDGKFNVHGACYCMSLKPEVSYDDILTVLTEKQYERLCNPTNGDDFTDIIERLESSENQALFEAVQEAEKEWLVENYGGLTESDVEDIYDNYGLDYRDRGIVGCVYGDEEELGREEAYSLGYVKYGDMMERYFDFERFGEDLLEEDYYLQVGSGLIVSLNY